MRGSRYPAAKVKHHVADAREHGAQILTGGMPWGNGSDDGSPFWTPTVLADAMHEMLCAREETFGPVAPLIPFNDEEEVVYVSLGV